MASTITSTWPSEELEPPYTGRVRCGAIHSPRLKRLLTEIRTERRYGLMHAVIEARDTRPVTELLPLFGLSSQTQALLRVSETLALQIARSILHKDIAYHTEIMPLPRADELARKFLASFRGPPVDYFSNGSFTHHDDGSVTLSSWSPLTEATFDTGIIVLDAGHVGCLWVEDED
jgi:hypothetical protein